MPRNFYFSLGTRNEKDLQESLFREAIAIAGLNVYYLPRTIVSRDTILNETIESTFGDAFLVAAYLDTVDGYEGDGTLLSKFGLEIRDQIRLVISKREWELFVGRFKIDNKVDPREGDLIYVPKPMNALFEIKLANGESPFYNLNNLPSWKLTCELFEYNNEDISAAVDGIEDIRIDQGARFRLLVGDNVTGGLLTIGEEVRQEINSDGDYISGIVAHVESDYSYVEVVQSRHSSDDSQTWLVTDLSNNIGRLIGQRSAAAYPITSIDLEDVLEARDATAQNASFEDIGDGFIDFDETNPFGTP